MSTGICGLGIVSGASITQYRTQAFFNKNLFLQLLNRSEALNQIENLDKIGCFIMTKYTGLPDNTVTSLNTACYPQRTLPVPAVPTCEFRAFRGYKEDNILEINRATCAPDKAPFRVMDGLLNFLNRISAHLEQYIFNALYQNAEYVGACNNTKSGIVPFYQDQDIGVFDFGDKDLTESTILDLVYKFETATRFNPLGVSHSGPMILFIDTAGMKALEAERASRAGCCTLMLENPTGITVNLTNDFISQIPAKTLYIPTANLWVFVKEPGFFKVDAAGRPIYPLFFAHALNAICAPNPVGNNIPDLSKQAEVHREFSSMEGRFGYTFAGADNIIERDLAAVLYWSAIVTTFLSDPYSATYLLGKTRAAGVPNAGAVTIPTTYIHN